MSMRKKNAGRSGQHPPGGRKAAAYKSTPEFPPEISPIISHRTHTNKKRKR
jgi:hypothetical protein